MKKILIILLVVLILVGALFLGLKFKKNHEVFISNPTSKSTQMILVRAHDWTSIMGTMQLYERATTKDAWVKVGDLMAASLGKNGLGWGIGLHGAALTDGPLVIEGSKRSPVGVFPLNLAFGQDKTFNTKLRYQQIDDTTFCPDDQKSKYYNHIVDSKKVRKDWDSAEDMYKYMLEGVYTYGLMIEHNYDHPKPGAGSCFFLHVYRGYGIPTAGCTAVSLDQVEKIIAWLDPSKKPILVQLPDPVFTKFQQQWNLPE